jgi:hypothetical protein
VLSRHRKFRAKLRFRADERNVKFECSVDHKKFRLCPSTLSRGFRRGKHLIRVRAKDTAGNVDRTPAGFHFFVL